MTSRLRRRAYRRHHSARLALISGSLLVASGLFFPWLLAGIASAGCGAHTCIPTGPVMTTVSGWQLLHSKAASESHLMTYSYLALVLVLVGITLTGIAVVSLLQRLPRLVMRVFISLTIAGLLVLGAETAVCVMNATSSAANTQNLLTVILVMFGGFALNIAGIVRLRLHH